MPNEGAPSLGEYLKSARLKRGMGQEQLAEAAGVSNAYVSLIETGRRGAARGVSRDIVLRLADALGESKSYLLTLAGHPLRDADDAGPTVEDAIKSDGLLRDDQRSILIGVYREMIGKR